MTEAKLLQVKAQALLLGLKIEVLGACIQLTGENNTPLCGVSKFCDSPQEALAWMKGFTTGQDYHEHHNWFLKHKVEKAQEAMNLLRAAEQTAMRDFEESSGRLNNLAKRF